MNLSLQHAALCSAGLSMEEASRQTLAVNYFRVTHSWGWTRHLTRVELLSLMRGLHLYQQQRGCDLSFYHREGVLAISGPQPLLVSLHQLVSVFKSFDCDIRHINQIMATVGDQDSSVSTHLMGSYAPIEMQVQLCDFVMNLSTHLRDRLKDSQWHHSAVEDLHTSQLSLAFAIDLPADRNTAVAQSEQLYTLMIDLGAVYHRAQALRQGQPQLCLQNALGQALFRLLQEDQAGLAWNRPTPLGLQTRVLAALAGYRYDCVTGEVVLQAS